MGVFLFITFYCISIVETNLKTMDKDLCKCEYPKCSKDNPVVTEQVLHIMTSPIDSIFVCVLCNRERKLKPRFIGKKK
jgi:hypothetical protein